MECRSMGVIENAVPCMVAARLRAPHWWPPPSRAYLPAGVLFFLLFLLFCCFPAAVEQTTSHPAMLNQEAGRSPSSRRSSELDRIQPSDRR